MKVGAHIGGMKKILIPALVLAGLVGCNQWDEVAERAVCICLSKELDQGASLLRWPKAGIRCPVGETSQRGVEMTGTQAGAVL